MNRIINFSLKNKFAVWLLTIIITVAGIYSGMNMKLETIPNITTPIVSVSTIYPGATPEEVADHVTKPIEKKVQNLNGVSVINSSSFQNVSNIQIQYKFDKNMDEAELEVEEALSNLTLPDKVNEPDVSRLSFNAFPVISLSIANENESLAQLTKRVEEEIAPALEGLEGVATVQVSGQQVEEVQLNFNQEKMEEFNLDQETVKNLIKGNDVTFPLGLYTFKDQEKSVVVDGNITTLEDLKSLEIPVVPARGNGIPQGISPSESGGTLPPAGQGKIQTEQNSVIPTVQLSEIAEIELLGKAESISRTNGQEAIGLQIVKAADANTVDVVNAVKQQAEEFEAEEESLTVISTFDQGEPIEESVNTMLSKALFGALFAVIIILLFLRNLRTTLISVISIPLSLLIAVLLLNQMDITLNIMTLGAMTVAIGRVVDDSIVVVENIYRRMSLKDEQLKGKALVREATKEMFKPIMSSTIVTIAVFLPLALVKGMVGELFLPFALTIVFALLASLLVAVTIVPMLAHGLFKKGVKLKHQHDEQHPGKLAAGYERVLSWTLNHKIITSILAIAMFVGSLALIPIVGVSFLSSGQEKMVVATYNPEPGQTLEEVKAQAKKAEDYFIGREGVETVQLSIGGENPMSPGQTNQALFFVGYDENTENFAEEKDQVIEDLKKISSTGEWASQSFGATGSSNKIKLFVYGDNLEELKPVVDELQQKMEEGDTFKKVSSSMSETYDEYTLVVNHEKLSELGLTAGQIGMALSPNRQQSVLTTIEKDGEELNVHVGVGVETYNSIDDLIEQKVQTPLGSEIAIKDVVEVQEGSTSNTVTRRDGKVYVEVSGVPSSENVAEASAILQDQINEVDLPAGVEVDIGGVTEDIQESFTQLGIAMLAAIAIVYFVLVVTFGGALAPFAILFSLPFSVIGGVLGLLISGETLSISAMIGALMLIGIVVTNAIVLVDRVIHKEEEGLATREALLEAGATRLRPILMTALATIGALLPLALGFEESGFISKGLGVTVIGGLASSTLLTLIIVPVVYEILSKFRRKKSTE
ncbi:efflux RND transporter permease subunit [Alkalihalobacillus sp. AL-G]|uniref:efflux RND transporter permease subunit n=1 Tax=Alkalihalobacillus sp. AL-G TaxID=2926399 RepID=UPI00272B2184|nr:efflux RND transporter permease subunit [Alkalihalobacillus sp. AL-G]WLD93286.1 efflux RND transporter permease subunit [Alkalihalobacillus sp. AL-G]